MVKVQRKCSREYANVGSEYVYTVHCSFNFEKFSSVHLFYMHHCVQSSFLLFRVGIVHQLVKAGLSFIMRTLSCSHFVNTQRQIVLVNCSQMTLVK
jgi:hypothetical protein